MQEVRGWVNAGRPGEAWASSLGVLHKLGARAGCTEPKATKTFFNDALRGGDGRPEHHVPCVVNTRDGKPDWRARYISKDLIASELREKKFSFAAELLTGSVKPFVELTLTSELNADTVVALSLQLSQVLAIEPENMTLVVREDKSDVFFRIIWPNAPVFRSVKALAEYIYEKTDGNHPYINMGVYDSRVRHDLIGSAPRVAGFDISTLSCVRPLTVEDNPLRLEWVDTADFSASVLESYLISSFDVETGFYEAGSEAPMTPMEEEPVDEPLTWIERCIAPVMERWHGCVYDVDGLRKTITFRNEDITQLPFVCLHGVRHEYGKLVCKYDVDGLATYRCENVPLGDRCEPFRIGTSDETVHRLKWCQLFGWIRKHGLARIDFPIFSCEWGGLAYSPREFYQTIDPSFDFDGIYVSHNESALRSGGYLLDMEFFEELIEANELFTAVHYINLFVNRVEGTRGKYWLRNLSGGYIQCDQSDVQNGIFASLKYFEIKTDARGNEKRIPKPFFKFWNEHHERRTFVSSGPQIFLPGSGLLGPGLNTLRPKATNIIEAEAFYDALTDKEQLWLHQVHRRILEVFTAKEDEANRASCQVFLDKYIGRLLFRCGEATQVALFIDSEGGATGKSSYVKFIAKVLGTHMVHAAKMSIFFTEKFNSEWNVPLIMMDDVAKNDLLQSGKKNARLDELSAAMKEWITAEVLYMQVKHGSNSLAQRKISNLIVTGNGVRIVGVNPTGRERRFFVCSPSSLEEQDAYFNGEGAFNCDCAADCGHSFSSHAQFWRNIFHDTIWEGNYFQEYVGMLYKRYKDNWEQDSRPLHLILPSTKRILEEQDLQSSKVEQWYARRVSLGYICNCKDIAFWAEGKIAMALPRGENPDSYGAEWVKVLPIPLLCAVFNRHTSSRMSEEDFERDLVAAVTSRKPGVQVQTLDCEGWIIKYANGGVDSRKEWAKGESPTFKLFCIELPKRVKQPVRLAEPEESRKVLKSTSGRLVTVSSTNALVQEASLNGFEYIPNSMSSQSNSSPPLPRRKRPREAYEVPFVEDRGDGEQDNGQRIVDESLSFSLEENSSDREFIDDDGANDGFE